MLKNKKNLLFITMLLLASCSGRSYYEPEPVGIGKGVDELKLSPCACLEVEVIKELPDWFVATI